MKQILISTVDRWGPGVIAIVALLATLWYGRKLEGKYGGLQTQIDQRVQSEIAIRNEFIAKEKEFKMEIRELSDEVISLRNWSIAVYTRTDQLGITIPEVPMREKGESKK